MSGVRHWTQETGHVALTSPSQPETRDGVDSYRPTLSAPVPPPVMGPASSNFAETATGIKRPVMHDKSTQTTGTMVEAVVGPAIASADEPVEVAVKSAVRRAIESVVGPDINLGASSGVETLGDPAVVQAVELVAQPESQSVVERAAEPVTVTEQKEEPMELLQDSPVPGPIPTSDPTPLPEETPARETASARRKHVETDAQTGEEYATLHPHGLEEVRTKIDNHWMYVFFRFCAERCRMQELRNSGVPRDQLSNDETMKKEHIGNIYREMDPGSKRMKEEIIANGDQSHEEICFRVFLFSGFYMATTWQALVEGLGEIPNWKNYSRDFEKYESILFNRSLRDRRVIYTSAFQLVPPTKYFGKNLPHFAATLRFIKSLMECGLPEKLRNCRYAVDASHIIQTIPTLGGFLSLNILCSLNDSPHTKFYYRNFASCGPGSRYFMQRMFGKSVINSVAMEAAGLKWLYDNQWTYWARIGEDPPHAWSIGIRPGMRVLDFENALCWAHRYVNAYLKKGYQSLGDLPPPDYDSETVSYSSMPAWCDEERHADDPSRAAFESDYEEEAAKLRQAELQRADQEIPEEHYEVERIVARKGQRTDKDGLYRVRWKGYPPEDDTWERASALGDGAKEALQEWLDWEQAVWGTIARITGEMPYKKPDDAPIMKYEIMDDMNPLIRHRTQSPRRVSKRVKVE